VTLVFESVLHVNSSSSSAAISTTPVSVALVGGDTTSTGSTVVVAFLGAGTQGVTTAPSGWVKVGPTVGSVGRLTAFRRGPTEGLVSGESSWSFTPSSGTANPLVWVVMELVGIDPDLPVDAVATTAIGLTTTSGTTFGPAAPQSTTYDGMVVCLHGSDVTAGGVPTTWSGHTGGFVEQAEQSSNDGVDAVDPPLSVSVLPVQTLGTFGATATNSGTLCTRSRSARPRRTSAGTRPPTMWP
jgi:hypothetical protein